MEQGQEVVMLEVGTEGGSYVGLFFGFPWFSSSGNDYSMRVIGVEAHNAHCRIANVIITLINNNLEKGKDKENGINVSPTNVNCQHKKKG